MSDFSAVYRENLNALCVKRGWESQKTPGFGSPSVLKKELGRTSSFWSDRLHGRKPISADLAYEIEDVLKLPRLTLEGASKERGAKWPFSDELCAAASKLGPVELRNAENILRLHLGLTTLPPILQEVLGGGSAKATASSPPNNMQMHPHDFMQSSASKRVRKSRASGQ